MSDAELERLRRVEDVARRILAAWQGQERRAADWQRLAARARARKPGEDAEALAIKAERRRLDRPRVVDFTALRVELGQALGDGGGDA